ncbi:MAG: bifunctional metallophosphatase/5'-nucleotidase [Synergistaceae bacterium]|nr:bifunctional metallophosphatase/5'-nucleotidase [Synergistaceae bacterium]
MSILRRCNLKKILSAAFLPALLLAAFFAYAAQAAGAEIVIFHTNDTHGRVEGNGKDIIGIDRVAAIHKTVPYSILVDAGDALQGLAIATLGKGEDIVALMNEAGYDAMTAGNHEFDYGFERLVELEGMADFPFLAANVMKDGKPLLSVLEIIEINGVKIGIFGVTTEETEHLAMPGNVRGLTFEDPIKAARETAKSLRGQGVHVVAALCHLGVTPYEGTLSTALAREVPEIDVIIDGHSHTALENGLLENGVLIAQAGQHGDNLGKVTIILEGGRIASKTASLISCEEAWQTPPDGAVAAKLSEIKAAQDVILKEPVGEAADAMSSARAPGVRTQEMPLGSLVADAYRESAKAGLAVTNGGDIRADVTPGVITKGDILNVLPYGNKLMVKTVTPVLLAKTLENGVSGIILDEQGNIDHEKSEQGRFLHVSGFRFGYDPSAPVGKRIVSITLDDGAALSLSDNTTRFSLAGSDYLMTGGDYYTMLGELPIDRDDLAAADEALAVYIRKHSPVSAPKEGRIIIQEAKTADKRTGCKLSYGYVALVLMGAALVKMKLKAAAQK